MYFHNMSREKLLAYYSNRYPTTASLANKAKKRVPKVAWAYLDTGTGDEQLLLENQRAFHDIKYRPQFCKGPLLAKTTTTLFGVEYPAPLGIAPIGLSGLVWPRAEVYLAQAANRLNIPYCLSTVATETPETLKAHIGHMGWFQLYPPKDESVRNDLLERAAKAGFHTLVITADVPMASRRERSRSAGLKIPPKITPELIRQGLTSPFWSYQTLRRGLPRLRTIEHYAQTRNMKFVSGFVGNRMGGTLDWAYCKAIKAAWDGPVVLKGLLHPDDALKAIDAGMDGIYVSNHGARQFNGGLPAIVALPEIVKAVAGQVPILFDSGIRTGLDMMRALNLGADFVFAGRPFMWGVAALGAYGGDHVGLTLIDDLRNNMVQLGVENLEALQQIIPKNVC